VLCEETTEWRAGSRVFDWLTAGPSRV